MAEPGEGLAEAAHRELAEETGLTGVLTPLNFIHSFWMDPAIIGLPPGPLRFNTETCFHMEVDPAAQVQLSLDEHSEFRWCPIEEAHALMLWDGSRTALLRLRKLLTD
jgi:8-oxo-dGTP pyrophosphatase MutT (NUDIX family)